MLKDYSWSSKLTDQEVEELEAQVCICGHQHLWHELEGQCHFGPECKCPQFGQTQGKTAIPEQKP